MTNLPSQGDPHCCRGGGTPEGQSVPERCRAYRWQYGAGEAYERIGVDLQPCFPAIEVGVRQRAARNHADGRAGRRSGRGLPSQ